MAPIDSFLVSSCVPVSGLWQMRELAADLCQIEQLERDRLTQGLVRHHSGRSSGGGEWSGYRRISEAGASIRFSAVSVPRERSHLPREDEGAEEFHQPRHGGRIDLHPYLDVLVKPVMREISAGNERS